jgi:hypothetical protein
MITALATQYRFPSIGPLELPAAGGLMGYGVNFAARPDPPTPLGLGGMGEGNAGITFRFCLAKNGNPSPSEDPNPRSPLGLGGWGRNSRTQRRAAVAQDYVEGKKIAKSTSPTGSACHCGTITKQLRISGSMMQSVLRTLRPSRRWASLLNITENVSFGYLLNRTARFLGKSGVPPGH